ncbi:hypothetical protein RYE12_17860 [Clostridioides difficile]|nr:hypothetical protein [Clostridioides difficile]MBY2032615.1 hypothetical protein [Clostridioides difficile]MBY2078212.1 hypothetical protein [Clostridioides difficile]MBY2111235.1 hypothetical protein [Clostridioides difficile]MBY2543965.1 hypothetical protein [Clostridioides difficile]
MKIEGTRFKLLKEYSDYPSENSKKRTRMLEVQCECGNIIKRPKSQILSGHTKSCGCLVRDILLERNTTHGLGKEECRAIFYSMHRRCYNPNHKSYKNYGGRGIKVCGEWHDIKNFVSWCKENGYKKGLQLDRIDNDGDYEPCNCRFVTVKQNLCNKRNTIMKDGMYFDEWLECLSNKHGILKNTLRSRYYYMKKNGYSEEDICENSIVNYKRKKRQSITNPSEKS